MLFQNFFQYLKQFGLEYFGLFYGHYQATVISNEDPEKKGRLKIRCEAIYGKESPNQWIWPIRDFAGKGVGLFAMPNKGDGVYIVCLNGQSKHARWIGGWWGEGDVPETARLCPPHVKILQSTCGHRVELDDTPGAEEIRIFHGKAGSYMKMDKSGNIKTKGTTWSHEGNVNVAGNINASGTIIDAGGNTNHHGH